MFRFQIGQMVTKVIVVLDNSGPNAYQFDRCGSKIAIIWKIDLENIDHIDQSTDLHCVVNKETGECVGIGYTTVSFNDDDYYYYS